MIIWRAHRDWIARDAMKALPGEACGVLVGSGDDLRVTGVYRSVNLASVPERQYSVDPVLIARLARRMRGDRQRILGYYHSHPSGGSMPSTADCCQAWPGMRYLIIPIREGLPRELRCWVRDPASAEFTEEEVRVI